MIPDDRTFKCASSSLQNDEIWRLNYEGGQFRHLDQNYIFDINSELRYDNGDKIRTD